ncbi:L-serine ammonia-lyase, iron-sulfur-dependent subunit beta [Miniphocaeibacter massiliensis]|uniref:L-serine ammonia-lyase, iron-sulfur-dependent subunit beta n=1 Tax=Miniphocaeibacter massiliensis TaxID=2041841 RepID=UPI000C08662F|nr:L-serine ammonia-lyase, iron-sulfur-dependent subunit beta [Miniphocaeibacter massiliensis]
MNEYNLFDILGPIMIGPSSSHTAGACRISKTARIISGADFNKIKFYLHGSFAETYRGHGTDKALLAGALGMYPDDERLKDSFEIARENELEYSFEKIDLGNVHPNTVKIEMYYPSGKINTVIGSSIGGGNIEIIEMNGIKIKFTNEFPLLIVRYKDIRGIISFISTLLSDNGYNIESMKTTKEEEDSVIVIELDKNIDDKVVKELLENKNVNFVKHLVKGF